MCACMYLCAHVQIYHYWQPTVDGVLIVKSAASLLATGATSQAAFLMGTNLDEGSVFSNQFNDTGTYMD